MLTAPHVHTLMIVLITQKALGNLLMKNVGLPQQHLAQERASSSCVLLQEEALSCPYSLACHFYHSPYCTVFVGIKADSGMPKAI